MHMSENTITAQPSSTRATSPLRATLRWIGRIVVGLLALIVVAVGVIYGITERRFRTTFTVPEHTLSVSTDSAAIARGERLATVRGCVECHGAGLVGATVIDQPIIGRFVGSNLTLGGRGADMTPLDWERAVRHGVRRDGKPLLFMPSNEFNSLTDEDLSAIITYARSVAPVRQPAPTTYAGPMLRALYAVGQVKLVPAEVVKHDRQHDASIVAEPTAAFGKYLANGCVGCHGDGLSGGKIPGAPPEWGPAANITPTGIGKWSEADFARALRTSRRPDGSAIDSTVMPIRVLRHMNDIEMAALYAYLRTVQPREFGNR